MHHQVDAESWQDASVFNPPLPGPVGGRGWAQLVVEFDGIDLWFSSAAELDHFIDVLSQNPLPSIRRMTELRGIGFGPNNHWLSRLPARAKPAKYRRRLVTYLRRVYPEEWSTAQSDDG